MCLTAPGRCAHTRTSTSVDLLRWRPTRSRGCAGHATGTWAQMHAHTKKTKRGEIGQPQSLPVRHACTPISTGHRQARPAQGREAGLPNHLQRGVVALLVCCVHQPQFASSQAVVNHGGKAGRLNMQATSLSCCTILAPRLQNQLVALTATAHQCVAGQLSHSWNTHTHTHAQQWRLPCRLHASACNAPASSSRPARAGRA
jgi:hypothetical protein